MAALPLIPLLIPSLAPSSVESGLTALQTQGSLFGLMWGLYLVSDLLYVIAFPALYIALRQLGRSIVVIALIFNALFVAIDVGIDIPLSLSLVRLSASYSAAQGAAQQAYVGAAALAMDVGGVASLIATFLQFSAVILASYAMTRTSVFGKTTGLLGIISGVVALLFIPAIIVGSPLAGLFNIGGFAFLVLWSLATGHRLYRA